jgi:hypothetical protein
VVRVPPESVNMPGVAGVQMDRPVDLEYMAWVLASIALEANKAEGGEQGVAVASVQKTDK